MVHVDRIVKLNWLSHFNGYSQFVGINYDKINSNLHNAQLIFLYPTPNFDYSIQIYQILGD